MQKVDPACFAEAPGVWQRFMLWISDHDFSDVKREGWLDALLLRAQDHSPCDPNNGICRLPGGDLGFTTAGTVSVVCGVEAQRRFLCRATEGPAERAELMNWCLRQSRRRHFTGLYVPEVHIPGYRSSALACSRN
jgi:hypothetical protein